MRRLAIRLILAGSILAGLAACETRQETRGYLPDEDRFAQIVKGVHDRNSVESLLGSPTSVSTFEDSVWYYITRQTEKLAFFEEELRDQQVVAVVFDKSGVVSDVRRYSMEDAREIDLVERETPTRGRELSLMEQLLGNFGRFTPRK